MDALASALVAIVAVLSFDHLPFPVAPWLRIVGAAALGAIAGPSLSGYLREFLLFLGDLADDLLGIGESLPRRVSRKEIERKDREVAYYARQGKIKRLQETYWRTW
jgi:hypothetical protein